ncbi:MAG: PadR family transcriptional regulator [Actinomycetales bacterium]|nr:PadR family transcriptional regulator [Actinomycetales bacterium]
MTVPMALLALLDGRPSHGFALKRRYDDLLGHDRELRFGQVYATLARLERDGLADGIGLERGDGADRKVYAITADGVAELDRWLAAPQLPGGRPAELFTKVILALAAHRSADAVLDAQRAVYLARMRELTARRGEGDAVDRLARDFEMAHLDADLRWIELAVARLADVRDGVDTALGGGPDE